MIVRACLNLTTRINLSLLLILIIILIACNPFPSESNPTPFAASGSASDYSVNVKIEEFSLNTSESNLPDNLVRDLYRFAGGGGSPIRDCGSELPEGIYLIDTEPSGFQIFNSNAELGQDVTIAICGHLNGDPTLAAITPAGETINLHIMGQHEEGGMDEVIAFFFSNPFGPTGTYTFVADGFSHDLGPSSLIFEKGKPSTIWYPSNKEVQVFNFTPNETVFVYAYITLDELVQLDGSAYYVDNLSGWHTYQVDESGNLVIKVQDDVYYGGFLAVGEISGAAVSLYRKEDMVLNRYRQ